MGDGYLSRSLIATVVAARGWAELQAVSPRQLLLCEIAAVLIDVAMPPFQTHRYSVHPCNVENFEAGRKRANVE